MKCPNCDVENPADANFCNGCGHKLEIICPDCQKTNPFGSKFCNVCGIQLRSPERPPSIEYGQPRAYTPKHLANKILSNRNSIVGERKLVTVLFADAANYTAMSEKLDPEEVHQIMDGCFRTLIDQIHRFEGTINQFTGDGIMALFGAPIAHEDHAQRACHAGLAIQEALSGYTAELNRSHGIDFNVRIGLNSGLVIVGAIGDDLQMDYTAIGDTVNLASRMESLAAPGGVLVSANTHRLVRDFFEFEPLGKIEVKGKEEPQEAFRLIKAGTVVTRIGASVAKGLTRFVGRKTSLPLLLSAFDQAKSGSGQVIGLVGEAGVGKSRLLMEMRNRLPLEEYNYIEGHCLHYGGSMAYLPALDILRFYFDIKEGDREFIAKKKIEEKILGLDEKLKNVIAPFQALLSLKVDDENFTLLEPKQKRERTFEALRDMLVRGSQERPLILAIEDIHWIDKTSEAFIDYLIGGLANTPILLILLYRPEYTHPWGSKSYYTKIGLDQLGTNSSCELVKAILEEGEVAPELRQIILKRAAGNPLFMEEFTQALLENGSIRKKGQHYVLSREAADIQVPDTIQGIIAARMDRLEDNLKRTMQVASVIGRDFAFRILQAITEMREELKTCLLNLQGLEFIYEKNLFPELEYIFKHALTQEVAYNSLLLKRRKEIHAKIGAAIETLYPERLEEFYEMLAYHYSKSDSLEKACRYSRLAGDKAESKYSHNEALDFYQQALDLLNKLPENTEIKKRKIKLLFSMRTPLIFLGFPEGLLDLLEEGERLSKELGDERYLARFHFALGNYYSAKGDPQLGIKYSADAFKVASKNRDVEVMAPLACGLVSIHNQTGDYCKVAAMAPPVIDLIEEKKRESDFFFLAANPYTLLCSYCGQSMGYLGAFNEGKVFLDKGLHHASATNDLMALGILEAQYGCFYLTKGDWEASKTHFKEGVQNSEAMKNDFMTAFGLSGLGYAWAMLGDPVIGKKHAQKGLDIYRNSGVEMYLSYIFHLIGMTNLELGDLKNARSQMEEALRLSKKNNEKGIEAFSLTALGMILGKIAPQNIEEAEGCLLKGIEICEKLKAKPFSAQGHLYLGELYLDAGEKLKAIKPLKKAEEMIREMGIDYWLGRAQEALAGK